MGELTRMTSELAAVLAFFGAATSAILLTDDRVRKQSELPAIVCLFCSLFYLAAFVRSKDPQMRHIEDQRAAFLTQGDDAAQLQRADPAAITEKTDIEDVMQPWSPQQ